MPPSYTTGAANRNNDYPYYRQIWLRVVLMLLAVAIIPLVVIGSGVVTYTFRTIEDMTIQALQARMRDHQQAIDHFLTQRLSQLKLIAATEPLDSLIEPGRLQYVFDAFGQQTSAFLDLGVIDLKGRHLAYVGPQDLLKNRYDQEAWFQQVIEKGIVVSDVYLGFRQSPHFIMAVQHGRGADGYILRATIDGSNFNTLVAGGYGDLGADTYIVNAQGRFQTGERLMALSGIQPDATQKGIGTIRQGGALVLTLWQEKVPWLNVVRVPEKVLFKRLDQARLAVTITFVIAVALIAATILLTTGHLVRRLENKRQRLGRLDRQLRRASYLASLMELSMVVFREIKDILCNIDISVQLLFSDHKRNSPADAPLVLGQIAGEAARGHQLFDKFITFAGPEDPVVTDVRVNEILDDLLGFLGKELDRRSIRIVRKYSAAIPALRSDRAKIRQVFLNLILNALAVLDKGGEIEFKIRPEIDHLIVMVRDNGPGIPPSEYEKIFEPLYTTKPRGTGLGLPICRSILEQMGGSISVSADLGKGAMFSVVLPIRIEGESASPKAVRSVRASPC